MSNTKRNYQFLNEDDKSQLKKVVIISFIAMLFLWLLEGIFLNMEVGAKLFILYATTIPNRIFIYMYPIYLSSNYFTLEKDFIYVKYFIRKKRIPYIQIKSIYFTDAHMKGRGGPLSNIPLKDRASIEGKEYVVQAVWISLFDVEKISVHKKIESNFQLSYFGSRKELYGMVYKKEVLDQILRKFNGNFYFGGKAMKYHLTEIEQLLRKHGVEDSRIHLLEQDWDE